MKSYLMQLKAIWPILQLKAPATATATTTTDERAVVLGPSSPPDHVIIEVFDDDVKEDPNNILIAPRSVTIPPTSRIMSLFQEYELGKTVLGFAVPVTMVLLTNSSAALPLVLHLVVVAISLGLAIIWNGILLRELFPRCSSLTEQLGVAIVFMGFFGLLASSLPLNLVWIPGLCWLFSLIPFILSHCEFLHTCTNDADADADRCSINMHQRVCIV